MSNEICYWDSVDKVQKVRDATPSELAEISQRAIDRAASAFPNAKAEFILQVKAEAGALTTQVLSGLGSEYELAEREVREYKAAGYPAATATVPIPNSVQDEIASKAAKGVTITATVACDNIIAAATRWRNAQSALRRNRLLAASAAEVAVDASALDTIKANHATFMTALKLQLNVS